jgi:hypothetical protein
LPKTCGNTRRIHRTLVLGGALACACTTVAGREETHIIGGHWASALCRPADTEKDLLAFELEALGDFPPSIDTHESLQGDGALVVPGTTRAAWLTANGPFSSFLGLGAAAQSGNIDVSLWPAGEFCELPVTASDCDYPGGGEGYAMGVSADGRTLLVAGGDAAREQDAEHTRNVASSAAVVDLATSRTSCLPRDAALQVARAGATVTPLGDALLVAGGYDPSSAGHAPVGSAETFDPTTRSFGADPISIPARAHHGAVALATGEVLLVGGLDEGGPIAEQTLAAVAAQSPRYRKSGFASISPRVDPVVLRLSDDRVFIAGGTDGNSPAAALPDLLWLDPSAHGVQHKLDALSCPDDAATVTVHSAFTAMPGGAVLGVGGCVVQSGTTKESCADPCPDGSGCASNEIFWIDRDGNVACCGAGRSACGDAAPDITAQPPPFHGPLLVGGEDGRPWLVDGPPTPTPGEPPPTARTLRRFEPWSGQFALLTMTTDRPVSAAVRADAGLFIALDDCSNQEAPPSCSASVYGFRHGLRGPYTQAVAPLLLTDTEGTAPDRPTGSPPDPGAVAAGPWRDTKNGEVHITAGSALVLTDTTYADVDVVVHATAGAPPLFHLGSATFGKASCQWPLPAPQTPFDAELVRRGPTVTLTVKGRTRTCAGPSGRAAISLSADHPVTIASVAVTRIAD